MADSMRGDWDPNSLSAYLPATIGMVPQTAQDTIMSQGREWHQCPSELYSIPEEVCIQLVIRACTLETEVLSNSEEGSTHESFSGNMGNHL